MDITCLIWLALSIQLLTDISTPSPVYKAKFLYKISQIKNDFCEWQNEHCCYIVSSTSYKCNVFGQQQTFHSMNLAGCLYVSHDKESSPGTTTRQAQRPMSLEPGPVSHGIMCASTISYTMEVIFYGKHTKQQKIYSLWKSLKSSTPEKKLS